MKCIECGEEIKIGGFGRFCVCCFLFEIAKSKSVLLILIFIAMTVILFEILFSFVGHNNLVVIVFTILLLIFLRELLKIRKSRKQRYKRR